MSSVFTQILNHQIPADMVYEDELVGAFMDIHPLTPGHMLVVPKVEVNKFYEVPEPYYSKMWCVAQKLAKHLEQLSGKRTLLKVIGTDVPHCHIHLFSLSDGEKSPLSGLDTAAIAQKIQNLLGEKK